MYIIVLSCVYKGVLDLKNKLGAKFNCITKLMTSFRKVIILEEILFYL